MAAAACTDEEFIALFRRLGSVETAKFLGVSERNVRKRRKRFEDRGVAVTGPGAPYQTFPTRREIEIQEGVILVASDCHYWPGVVSTAHRAFVRACKELKPVAIVMNGDVFDGAAVSRHPPIGWSRMPGVQEELEACQERLAEIMNAAPKAMRFWTLGNHDMRFMSRLAANTPQYKDVEGFDIQDHFSDWQFSMSVRVCDSVVIKHRYRGGIHAAHNNTVNAGRSIVTGHLHSLKVTPFSDYNGTRYGVDTGTLACPHGPQFSYGEDNPQNHRSGFAVLTMCDGELLPPELLIVYDEAEGIVVFRGRKYKV